MLNLKLDFLTQVVFETTILDQVEFETTILNQNEFRLGYARLG